MDSDTVVGEDHGKWPKEVLVIAPHAEYFIGDQLRSLEGLVGGISILIPSPYLAGLTAHLTGGSGRFESLRRAALSRKGPLKDRILEAKYLEIPGSVTRRKTYSLAARSSEHSVMSSNRDFGVIHAHFIGLSGYIGNVLRIKLKKPFVLTAHGGDAYDLPFRDPFHRQLAEELVIGADRLIAVSNPIAESLVKLGSDKCKIEVIPNGYDDSLFFPRELQDARTHLNLPLDRRILLVVANLVPQKGHRYLIEALQQVVKIRRDLLLVIVGKGDLEQELRTLASKLDLTDHILFAGPRPHDEVEEWINSCDLFVLPSIKEGSPTILAEVMACGKPVVASSVGGVPDMVQEGRTGRMVPASNVEELSKAILESLDRNWDSREICEAGRKYSWKSLAPRIVEVYRSAAAGG